MFDASYFIDKINSETSYIAQWAKAKEPIEISEQELPKIYVGYANIDSINPTNPKTYDEFELHGEDLTQYFDIQINCKIEDLPTIWQTVYDLFVGENPVPTEKNYSGLTYSQGGVMGLENKTIWWVDRWKISFPTLNVF